MNAHRFVRSSLVLIFGLLAVSSGLGIVALSLSTWGVEVVHSLLFGRPVDNVILTAGILGCYAGFSVLLSVFLQRLFSSYSERAAYRLALGIVLALDAALPVLKLSYGQGQPRLWNTVVAAVGGFAGLLWSTSRRYGLSEQNGAPPQFLLDQVYLAHESIAGNLVRKPWLKRLFDVCLVTIGLIGSAPFWLFFVLFTWWEYPGPIFFVKVVVGKGGRTFKQFKFRTMVPNAEAQTGPTAAAKDDPRITRFGRFLRRTALDELPQLINIIRGEMSFVGPRPQRVVLVYEDLLTVPGYAERHRVQPGIAGLAQVCGHYWVTPLQRVRYDRLYIKNLSLRLDLELLVLAFLIAFWWRWLPGWDERISKKWRRLGHRSRPKASRACVSHPEPRDGKLLNDEQPHEGGTRPAEEDVSVACGSH
jgi:lipopolysaccharide/colanic/teichoic acid biosynthesis glycosyltransferase